MSSYEIQFSGQFDTSAPGEYGFDLKTFSITSTNGTVPSPSVSVSSTGLYDYLVLGTAYKIISRQSVLYTDTTPPPVIRIPVAATGTKKQMSSSACWLFESLGQYYLSGSNGTQASISQPFVGGYLYKSKVFSFNNLGGVTTGQIYPRNFTVFKEPGASSITTSFGTFTTTSFKASTQKIFLQYMTYPRSLY